MTELPLQKRDLAGDIADRWLAGSVLVVGPLGLGKLTALRQAASVLANGDQPALEFAASTYTTMEDLVGRHAVRHGVASGADKKRFVSGLLTEAMRDGRRLIIADADLLAGDARNALLAVLHGTALPPFKDGSLITTIIRPGFTLAATASRMDFELAGAFGHTVNAE